VSATALSDAVERAQHEWALIIAAESVRGAKSALEGVSPDLIAARASMIVEANVNAAGREGALTIDQVLAATGREPTGAADSIDLAPSIDVTSAVIRAWRKARAAAADGEQLHTGFLRSELTRIIGDTLTDAWRDGQVAAMDAHPEIIGYRRITRPGCCGACLALANGDILPVGEPFEAHGRCRCTLEPVIADVNDSDWGRPTGAERWEQMSPGEQDETFAGHGGRAKADLLRAGVITLEQLITREPRPPGRRPLTRETTLAELAAA